MFWSVQFTSNGENPCSNGHLCTTRDFFATFSSISDKFFLGSENICLGNQNVQSKQRSGGYRAKHFKTSHSKTGRDACYKNLLYLDFVCMESAVNKELTKKT